MQQLPDEDSWQALMQPVHDTLGAAEGTAAQPLRRVDPDAARQVGWSRIYLRLDYLVVWA